MIVRLGPQIPRERIDALLTHHRGHLVDDGGEAVAVFSASLRSLDPQFDDLDLAPVVFADDRQLSHPDYRPRRTVRVAGAELGGTADQTMLIAGPCSVESAEQIHTVARWLRALGLRALRGGAFKPRTSPYSFQGLGLLGLRLLREACDEHELALVTEVRDASHVESVIEAADVIQVGAKAMYDHGILRACGRTRKPILLKRGFGSTLQEFAQAAEFVLSGGNTNVILCERGIRTFETKTRFTLDLCGVAWLKRETNLPVVVDPSHAIGHAWGVPDLACAAMAMGVDGLLIETHPDPRMAKSDAAQQLDLREFAALHDRLSSLAPAVGRTLV